MGPDEHRPPAEIGVTSTTPVTHVLARREISEPCRSFLSPSQHLLHLADKPEGCGNIGIGATPVPAPCFSPKARGILDSGKGNLSREHRELDHVCHGELTEVNSVIASDINFSHACNAFLPFIEHAP